MSPSESEIPDESPRDGALPLSDELSLAKLSHNVAVEAGIGEDQAKKAVRVIQRHSLHIGPYPNAVEVARLNEIEPGLGTRLIEDFLEQQRHERQLNNRAASIAEQDSAREDGRLRYSRRGQSIGFVLVFAFLFSALYCAVALHQFWLAGLFIAGPTIGVVAHFVQGAGRE